MIIVPKLPTHLQPKSETESSYAVPTQKLLDEKYAGAEFGASQDVRKRDAPRITGPEGLTQAVLAGKKGVRLGGQSYKFGEGSGAYVKIVPGSETEAGPKMAGTAGNEALDPEFAGTLGHELGHAMKIRAGALAPGTDSAVMSALEPDENEQMLWSKRPEEFVNVNAIENKIRQEHGVPERKYHKPLSSVIASQRATELYTLYDANRVRDEPMWVDMEDYTSAAQLVSSGKTSLGDDAVYAKRKTDLTQLLPKIGPAGVKAWKTEQVNAAVRRIEGQIEDPAVVFRVTPWMELRRELSTKGDQIVAPGNAELKTWLKKVKDVEQNLPALVKDARRSKGKPAKR